MSAADSALLADLPALAFGFVILIARCGGACMLLPGIGETQLPTMVRAGIAVALTLLLLPVLAPTLPPPPASPWRLFAMVGAEVLTGLWLGWLARLAMLALPIAGQIIAGLTGLSNVLEPDPRLGSQNSALGQAFGLAAPVLILAGGLHALPIAALAGSYRLIPAGALLPAADTTQAVVGAVSQSFALALRLAAPFVLAGIVWHVALGLLARLVPQLQVFFAALPGQILGALALLAVLGVGIIDAWREQIAHIFATLPGL
jgi:flagellar biosynthetic protein FliR